MGIKVLGTKCAGCKALYKTTKRVILGLSYSVVLIKEGDLSKIMEHNVLSLPASVIDGKVVSAGKRLSLAGVKESITQQYYSYEEIPLFTILSHYLNILW